MFLGSLPWYALAVGLNQDGFLVAGFGSELAALALYILSSIVALFTRR
ncbi:MAG TPA: hypothetical protein VHE37_05395 [Nevskiaceae bacterium]|nr:hypothetical protein [Nevskiaceae bacterium]